MKKSVFAVYDNKSASYLQPEFFKRKEQAVRSFEVACQKVDSDFFMYAEDFALFHLGEYDDDTGILQPLQTPKMVITAVQASVQHRDHYASLELVKTDKAS